MSMMEVNLHVMLYKYIRVKYLSVLALFLILGSVVIVGGGENVINVDSAKSQVNITIWPSELENIDWQDNMDITINITCQEVTPGLYMLNVVSQNPEVASVEELVDGKIPCRSSEPNAQDPGEEVVVSHMVTLRGEFLGRTNITVYVKSENSKDDSNNVTNHGEEKYEVGFCFRKLVCFSYSIVELRTEYTCTTICTCNVTYT